MWGRISVSDPSDLTVCSRVRCWRVPAISSSPWEKRQDETNAEALLVDGLFSIAGRSRAVSQLSHFERWSLVEKQNRESQAMRKPQQSHQTYQIPCLSTFKTQHHRISAIHPTRNLFCLSLRNHVLTSSAGYNCNRSQTLRIFSGKCRRRLSLLEQTKEKKVDPSRKAVVSHLYIKTSSLLQSYAEDKERLENSPHYLPGGVALEYTPTLSLCRC